MGFQEMGCEPVQWMKEGKLVDGSWGGCQKNTLQTDWFSS